MTQSERNNVLIEFFKMIPRIFCVSYISNRERRDKIQPLWDGLGISNKIEYVYGVPDNKSYKCSCKVIHDHVSVFVKAYRENWPFVFVFEDDVVLHEEMLQIELEEIRKFLEEKKDGRGWSAVMLGYDPRHFFLYDSWKSGDGMKKSEKNLLFRMNGLFSHAYLISREGMEKFLSTWREPIHPIHVGVIDSFFLVSDGVFGVSHNIFGQLGVDMKQKSNLVNSHLFFIANWIWWNRLEGICGIFVVLIFWKLFRK